MKNGIELEKLLDSTETDYLDFKMKWHDNNAELLRDILCMANSLSDSPDRYIVIGVKEDSDNKVKTFFDISGDEHRKSSEDLITLCREYITVLPELEVITEKHKDRESEKQIDIIKISPQRRDLPYVSYKDKRLDKKGILRNVVYSRTGSDNTPWNESCDKSVIEELFSRKKGEDLSAIDRFSMYLDDFQNWRHVNGSEDTYYYKGNYKFKIIRYKADDQMYQKVNELESYHNLLTDVGLSKEYW